MERDIDFESYPIVELDSDNDDDSCTSSEDEIDILLSGVQGQKEQLQRSLGQKSSSSEDEFEKEMAAELDQRMVSIANIHKGTLSLGNGSKGNSTRNKSESSQRKYEDEFLDSIDRSDDEEDTEKAGQSGSQNQPSNDDLLYDPDMDDEDQKWVDKQRQSYQPKSAGKAGSKRQMTTDAVLCCPACMISLCRDCQRHSLYKNQFRAMFVMNCSVDKTEFMRYPVQSHKKSNKNRKKNKKQEQCDNINVSGSSEPAESGKMDENKGQDDNTSASLSDNVVEEGGNAVNGADGEMYHPVRCEQCTTEVGVFDSDEVFHFFNVIESNG